MQGCNRWPSFLFKSFAVGDNGNTTQPQGTNKPQPQPVPAFIRPFKLHCNTVATCNGHEINTFN